MTSQIFSDEVALEDQGPQILLLWIQSVSIPQKMLERAMQYIFNAHHQMTMLCCQNKSLIMGVGECQLNCL